MFQAPEALCVYIANTEKGNGNPRQCSCLGNPVDKGAWRATVYGVTELNTTEELSLTYSLQILYSSCLCLKIAVYNTYQIIQFLNLLFDLLFDGHPFMSINLFLYLDYTKSHWLDMLKF